MTTTYVRFDLHERAARAELLVRIPDGARESLPALLRASLAWRGTSGDAKSRSDLVSGGIDAELVRDISDYLYADGSLNSSRLYRHFEALVGGGRICRFVARPGATATGHELVGRDAVLGDLTELLGAGRSVHLRAPRRYGKTSVLEALADRLRATGRHLLLLDVASVDDLEGFAVKVAGTALAAESGRALSAAFGLGATDPAGIREAARRDGGVLLGRILVALGASGHVLALDEISLFLRGAVPRATNLKEAAKAPKKKRAEGRAVLDALRSARAALPQVFAGSTGLSAFARLHRLGDLLEDLAATALAPLRPADAGWLLEEMLLADERRPMPDAAAAVLEHIGAPVPYYLHAFADALRTAVPPAGPVTRADVERVYARWLAGSADSNVFAGYRLRNQAYPQKYRRIAQAILDAIAGRPEGAARAELEPLARGVPPGTLDALLECVAEDFDLLEEDGRWAFRSKLLRERWAQADQWLTSAKEDR